MIAQENAFFIPNYLVSASNYKTPSEAVFTTSHKRTFHKCYCSHHSLVEKERGSLFIDSFLFVLHFLCRKKNPITHKKMQVKCSHLKSSLISSDLRSLYKNVLFPFSSQEKMFQKQHIKKYSMSLKLEQKMFYRLTNIVMNLHNLN